MTIIGKLADIQKKIKAPKSQYNSFGKYNYRNCEDILEALKPILGDAAVVITDEIVEVGGRVYVKATAKFCFEDQIIENTAYAREPESKKGMDESQITGTASSYSRKYALNGLFLIDDTKDADSMDNRSTKPNTKDYSQDIEWYKNAPQAERDAKWPKLSVDVQNAIVEAFK